MSGTSALLFVRNGFTHDARVTRAARVLSDLGLEPTVVAVRTPGTQAREHCSGVEIVRLAPIPRPLQRLRAQVGPSGGVGGAGGPVLGKTPFKARLRRLLVAVVYYRRGAGMVLKWRPAIVHCNDHNTMWIGVAARLLTGARVVYDSHELWPDRNGRWESRAWLLATEWIFVRAAHRVIVSSPGHAAVISHRYRIAEPVLIRNIPEHPPLVQPVSTGPRAQGRHSVGVYAGGLQAHRGIEQAIEALGESSDTRLRLLGAGRDGYVECLRELAERCGVSSRVEFAGLVPNEILIEEISRADFGLALFQPTCLSHRLVLPNKVFEYLHAGVPVLASDLPVLREYVGDPGRGVCVPAEDPVAIARGMTKIAGAEANRMYRRAAVEAASAFTWNQEKETLSRCYLPSHVSSTA